MHPTKSAPITGTRTRVSKAKRTNKDATTRDGILRDQVKTWIAKGAEDKCEWTRVSARDGDIEMTVAVRGRFNVSKRATDEIAKRLYDWMNDGIDVLVTNGLIRIEWVSNR
jgi:hypothetical protein